MSLHPNNQTNYFKRIAWGFLILVSIMYLGSSLSLKQHTHFDKKDNAADDRNLFVDSSVQKPKNNERQVDEENQNKQDHITTIEHNNLLSSSRLTSEPQDQAYKAPYPWFPSKRQYQQQVKKNPHDLPEIWTPFAAEMAHLMTTAKQDKQQAKIIFGNLAKCAQASANEELLAVRIVCTKNAERITTWYPSFKPSYKKLMTHIAPDVKSRI